MLRPLLEQLAGALRELKRDGENTVSIPQKTLTDLDNLADKIIAETPPPAATETPANTATPTAIEPPASAEPPANTGNAAGTTGTGGSDSAICNSSFVISNSRSDSEASTGGSDSAIRNSSFVISNSSAAAATLPALREALLRAFPAPPSRLVFGEGDTSPDICFIGDAPDTEEISATDPADPRFGLPFIGPAGQLLTKIIAAMGYNRAAGTGAAGGTSTAGTSRIYITTIVRWRPALHPEQAHLALAGNTPPPTPAELQQSLPFLDTQLDLLRPRLIIALGNAVIGTLLGDPKENTVGKIHGQLRTYRNFPLLPTYSPAYLLRKSDKKSKRILWEDLLTALEFLNAPISEKQRNYFL